MLKSEGMIGVKRETKLSVEDDGYNGLLIDLSSILIDLRLS